MPRALLVLLGALAVPAGCATLNLHEVQSSYGKPSNVALYFRVERSDGEPVAGLTADQFNVYEDGAIVSQYESKQTILNPEVAASHYTILLVDMSGSVAQSEDAALVGEAAQVFTSRVEANNEVAVYAFDGSDKIHKIRGFTASAGSADAGVGSVGGFASKDPSTNLNGAVVLGLAELDAALEEAENPLRFGTLVVFTDGTDRAARVGNDEMLQAVRDTPYEVFAIGLGAEISEDHLDAIGKSGFALAADRTAVVQAFEAVAERIEGMTKSYYLLSYCSPARAGVHEVTIEAVQPTEDGKGEVKGELTSGFDAEGFKPECDPNQAPKFDITKGAALQPAPKKKKLFSGGSGRGAGKAGAGGEVKAGAEAQGD
jgi:hypothetical protein